MGERPTGRKRKHYQMECDQTEESKRKTLELKQKIEKLEDTIADHQRREDLFLKDKEKLVKLYQLGKIDSDGKYIESD